METYKEFLDKTKNIVSCDAKPLLTKAWFENCIESHKNLLELVQSYEVNHSFRIENKSLPADKKKIFELIDNLQNIAGKTVNISHNLEYNLGSDWKDKILRPTIPNGNHNVFKTSKRIMDLLGRHFPAGEKKAQLDKTISTMGEVWAKSNVKEQNLSAKFSFLPSAFAFLGHYDIDNNSCFKKGGGSENNKYYLAETKDTFIVVFTDKDKIVGRLWGFLSKNQLNFCNYYFAPKVHEGNIRECLKFLSSSILKIDFDNLDIQEGHIANITNVYLNDYFNISIAPKNTHKNAETFLKTSWYGKHKCVDCSNIATNTFENSVYRCHNCMKGAKWSDTAKVWYYDKPIKTKKTLSRI